MCPNRSSRSRSPPGRRTSFCGCVQEAVGKPQLTLHRPYTILVPSHTLSSEPATRVWPETWRLSDVFSLFLVNSFRRPLSEASSQFRQESATSPEIGSARNTIPCTEPLSPLGPSRLEIRGDDFVLDGHVHRIISGSVSGATACSCISGLRQCILCSGLGFEAAGEI